MGDKDTVIRLVMSDASAMICKLIGDGLRRARFEVTDCVVTSSELITTVQQKRVDVAVISAHLQDGRLAGFHALQRIREVASMVRPIIILDERDPELVISAFCGGAKAVLSRAEAFSAMCKCVRAVSEGQICATPADIEALMEALSRVAPRRVPSLDPARPLTRREQEVVSWVQLGYNNREIAEKLHVSEHTVKNHLFRIFEKLGVSNRVELAVWTLPSSATGQADGNITGILKVA